MKKTKVIASSLVAGTMVMASCIPAFAYTKEETVYSKLKSDGSEKTTIVSEHLKNDDKEKTIEDLSTLTDILNVNGEEKFTQDGQKISWEANGNDIYYQGNTDKKLPISMEITYKLNGKESTVKKMLGKKGTVEINIEYTNNEKQTVDGEELYVPFVVTTGTMLPTDNNSQVEVTNGKVVSNGSNNIIVALAAPGLAEDFDNKEELQDLNHVTIKYETKKFELSSIMTVATPSLLSESDLDVFDNMDNIYSMVDQLSSSYSQIVTGGKTLESGLQELSTKYGQFDQGVNTLSGGVDSLNDGAKQLSQGAAALNDGIVALAGGIDQLSQSSGQLRSGTETLCNQVCASARQQIIAKIVAATGVSQEQAEQMVPQMTITNYSQVLTGLESQLGSLADVKAQLDQVYQLYAGINTYTGAVDQISQNTPALKEGSSQLVNGTKSLESGVSTLQNGAKALSANSSLLNQAIKQLSNGSTQLVDGLTQFDEQGISKISQFINGDLKTDADKAEKLSNLSQSYKTFTESAEGVESSTKFIMIVNSQKKK